MLEYGLTFLASVFTKKVNWDQLLGTVEANRKVVGAQGRKRKKRVKGHVHKLDAFRFVGLGGGLFWSTQAPIEAALNP